MIHPRFFLRAEGLALVLSAAIMSPAWAASHEGAHGAHGDHGKPTAAAFSSDMTDGEVRKVDKESGKLTLRHAEIKSLDMPPMTMVFQVKERSLLDKVKAGDKVRFRAEQSASGLVVSAIEPAK